MMSTRSSLNCWRMGIATIGLAGSIAAVAGTNVSQIATGAYSYIDWAVEATIAKTPCGAACSYAPRSTAWINPDSAAASNPATWPDALHASKPKPPPIVREIPTPQGLPDNNGVVQDFNADFYRRAAVEFPTFGTRAVAAMTSKSGEARAAYSHHLRIVNDSAATRNYFIEFTPPTRTASRAQATYLIDNFILTYGPKSAASRSSVDIYVNGLPVWSQANTFHRPANFSGNDGIDVAWDTQLNGGSQILYLGRLAAGATMQVSYVISSEARADAPQCGKTAHTYPTGPTEVNCYTVYERLSLPGTVSARSLLPSFSFDVYSKPLF
jgi:hypothetical protein